MQAGGSCLLRKRSKQGTVLGGGGARRTLQVFVDIPTAFDLSVFCATADPVPGVPAMIVLLTYKLLPKCKGNILVQCISALFKCISSKCRDGGEVVLRVGLGFPCKGDRTWSQTTIPTSCSRADGPSMRMIGSFSLLLSIAQRSELMPQRLFLWPNGERLQKGFPNEASTPLNLAGIRSSHKSQSRCLGIGNIAVCPLIGAFERRLHWPRERATTHVDSGGHLVAYSCSECCSAVERANEFPFSPICYHPIVMDETNRDRHTLLTTREQVLSSIGVVFADDKNTPWCNAVDLHTVECNAV